MVAIVKPMRTVDSIYEWSLQRNLEKQKDRPQGRMLHCSSLGDDCSRKLWYGLNLPDQPADDIDGRKARLFERGDLEEHRFNEALRGIGCEVWGDQQRVLGLEGRLSGHIDGMVKGLVEAPETVHLLEYKTHNAANFKQLQNKGVKQAHFKHYVQMQMYMGLLGLTRAFYLAVNKDNDELYQERIKFDKVFFEARLEKARRILEAQNEPPRVSERKSYYLCKFCKFREYCHGK